MLGKENNYPVFAICLKIISLRYNPYAKEVYFVMVCSAALRI